MQQHASGVGAIMDSVIHHAESHYRRLGKIALWIFAWLPFFIVGAVVGAVGVANENGSLLVIAAAITILGGIVAVVLGYWIFNSLVLTVDATRTNQPPDQKALNRKAWSRFWPAVGVSILSALAAIAPLLLMVPGFLLLFFGPRANGSAVLAAIGIGIFFIGAVAALLIIAWLAVTVTFAPYALLLENKGVVDSLRRARELVRGQWWAACLRSLLPKLVVLAVVIGIQLALSFGLMIAVAGTAAGSSDSVTTLSVGIIVVSVLKQLISLALALVVTPTFVLIDYYVYRYLREREAAA